MASLDMQDFLAANHTALTAQNYTSALASCMDLCTGRWWNELPEECGNLVELLCGIKESDPKVIAERYPSVVVLGDIVTVPLEVLMGHEDQCDPCRHLFRKCQRLFRDSISQSKRHIRNQDWCEGKALEHAFLWSLACKSFNASKPPFGELPFLFNCAEIKPGRIFPDRNVDCKLIVDEVGKLEDGGLYYAKESSGASHPRADLWFKAPLMSTTVA